MITEPSIKYFVYNNAIHSSAHEARIAAALYHVPIPPEVKRMDDLQALIRAVSTCLGYKGDLQIVVQKTEVSYTEHSTN